MNSLVEQVMFPLSNKSKHAPQRLFHHLYIRKERSRRVILFSHGNGTTLDRAEEGLRELADECNMSVFAYEYPGYGECIGIATSSTVNAAIQHAHRVLVDTYEYSPENIILMGRSIGTGPTLWLTEQLFYQPPAVVLISPFTSIGDIISLYPVCGLQHFARFMFTEVYDNVERVAELRAPLLIIHGEEDEVIPVSMSIDLHRECPSEHKSLCVKSGGTHNQFVWDIKEVAIFLGKYTGTPEEWRERMYSWS